MGTVPTQVTNNKVDHKDMEAWRIKTIDLSVKVYITQAAYLWRVKASNICSIHLTHFTCKRANFSRNRHITVCMDIRSKCKHTLLILRFSKL